jgi:hypothetical protein
LVEESVDTKAEETEDLETRLLGLEKRLINLELSTKDLKSDLKNINLTDIQQKIEKIEEFITMEREALANLVKQKNLPKEMTWKASAPVEVEARIYKLESDVSKILDKSMETTLELEERLNGLENDIIAISEDTENEEADRRIDNLNERLKRIEEELKIESKPKSHFELPFFKKKLKNE